ncbi:MAG: hypothetical protein OXF98_02835 [Rhodospirillaceae bacterium]|nr:hypothetical protein [Rhodospirillaceae bacterium]
MVGAVTESRIVLGPGDIVRVRVVCTVCEGEIVHPMGLTQAIVIPAKKCPHCKNVWISSPGDRRTHEELTNLVRAAKYLAKRDEKGAGPFSLKFELEDDR